MPSLMKAYEMQMRRAFEERGTHSSQCRKSVEDDDAVILSAFRELAKITPTFRVDLNPNALAVVYRPHLYWPSAEQLLEVCARTVCDPYVLLGIISRSEAGSCMMRRDFDYCCRNWAREGYVPPDDPNPLPELPPVLAVGAAVTLLDVTAESNARSRVRRTETLLPCEVVSWGDAGASAPFVRVRDSTPHPPPTHMRDHRL